MQHEYQNAFELSIINLRTKIATDQGWTKIEKTYPYTDDHRRWSLDGRPPESTDSHPYREEVPKYESSLDAIMPVIRKISEADHPKFLALISDGFPSSGVVNDWWSLLEISPSKFAEAYIKLKNL